MRKIFHTHWSIVFLVLFFMHGMNILKPMEKKDDKKMFTLKVALEQRKMKGYAQDIRLIMDALSNPEEDSSELEASATGVLKEALPQIQLLDLSKKKAKGLMSKAVAILSKYELKELLFLNLTGCETLTSDDIKSIVEKSPKVQTVLLTDCKSIDSKVFSVLATYCKQLTCLSIQGCEKITDQKMLKGFVQVCTSLTRLHCANTHFTNSKSALLALNRRLTIDTEPIAFMHSEEEEYDQLEEDDDDETPKTPPSSSPSSSKQIISASYFSSLPSLSDLSKRLNRWYPF